MAALRRIENFCDRTEDDHDAGAKQTKAQNQDDREYGQDECIFDQGLPFFAGTTPGFKGKKEVKDGSHCGR
jgi:hypothetical protein